MTSTNPDRNLVKVGNVWKARWWEDGKERRRSLGTSSLATARTKLRRVMAEVNARRNGVAVVEEEAPRNGKNSWAAIRTEYERSPRFAALAEKARTRYVLELTRVGRWLEEEGIAAAAVERNTIDEFVEDLREDGLKVSSIKNALTAWSQCFDRGVARGLLPSNPLDLFKRGDLGNDAAFMNPPLNGEHDRMLPDIVRFAPRLYDLDRFLHETGCRLTEALMLRGEDRIDADNIYLHRGVKRSRPRTIALNNAAAVLDRLPRSGRVFADLPGDAATVSGMWSKMFEQRRAAAEAEAEGRPLTPWEERRWRLHDERHAFAIETILEGQQRPEGPNIYGLRDHLGHRSIKTTEGYLEAMKRLPVRPLRGLARERRLETRHFWVPNTVVEGFNSGPLKTVSVSRSGIVAEVLDE